MKRWTPTFWMGIAESFATQSSCRKRQVGCLIVKDGFLLSAGVNGTTPGDSNNCEDETGQTEHWRVHHAERNSLRNLTYTEAKGAVAYVTTAPCWECGKELIGYGITKVYYGECKEEYEDVLSYLEQHMEVEQC